MTGTLIVALDLDTRAQAEQVIADIGEAVDFYKIGYQLFYGGDGLNLGKALIAAGKRVFFDLKLLDIDNTVEKGAAAIAETGAQMLTVHAYPKAIRAALKGTRGSSLSILGVTVLTSMDDQDVHDAGYARDAAGLVALRAEDARAAGIGGLVCSPREAGLVRNIVGPGMSIVTPGIRPTWAEHGDQKRVTGPREALDAGASHLVVGRPITAAPDPAEAARRVLAEMAGGTRLA
ncbi:orotidine 5'-phosphate decarboxylase [Youhaiella tibetensis]|uniref:Orotidine 5'-phosphate decarboxylase n=1 Tax=Paradevosia tibetensis TaxID=1447062 RepID=A0A5B9DUY5_9HYPH|nr:orotidine-5'-phosphate decarboxylase [Youhaiella tibetensis]QEE22519.1 orotidine-5'-phosphate decarboxylase [Youhaiella tibetensis]GGF41551.1 orotidine 5'-phosphate decarboxylase [Youhaiella tibetensis]